MDKTYRGIGGNSPSISKGVKGEHIRYNFHEGITTYDGRIKNTYERKGFVAYKEKNKTRLKDIEFYLGSDWIDWDCTKIEVNDTSLRGGKIATKSKVLRCNSCGEAYQTHTIDAAGKKIGNGNVILSDTLFRNVPLYKGECGLPDKCNG